MPKIRNWLENRRYQPTFAIEKVAASAHPEKATAQFAQFDVVADQHLVPYDENLLGQSRIQWQLGEWASLANLNRDTLQHHPDRANLAALAAAGQIQNNSATAAQQWVRLAQGWGCSKKMVSQVLVAGVYSTLGKATLIAGDRQRALAHYRTAASVANQKANSSLLAKTHTMRETLHLDAALQAVSLPPPAQPERPKLAKPNAGITSYAQNFEDVMLWLALGRVETVFTLMWARMTLWWTLSAKRFTTTAGVACMSSHWLNMPQHCDMTDPMNL